MKIYNEENHFNNIPFHQQLNEDHQHRQDKYNDEEEQVEHQYKQHDKAKIINLVFLFLLSSSYLCFGHSGLLFKDILSSVLSKAANDKPYCSKIKN